jgi:hypothetical protein
LITGVQTSKLLDEFKTVFPHLLKLMLDEEFSHSISANCSCDGGKEGLKRIVRCHDCLQYQPSCPDCFINSHRSMPTHWAEVWDDRQGFFVRHDISVVRSSGYATQLGHYGAECPCCPPDRFFILVDTNGIHNTKIRFCECSSASLDQVDQLMSMGLFPATLKQPRMAFTFRVLRQAHLMNLESKAAMYDFVGTLRRLTDNAFAQETSVWCAISLFKNKLI